MYQKDYVLRMISQIIKFLGEVLGLVKKGELQKASRQLSEGYMIFLKEDAAFFQNIPEEKLTETLLKEHNYTNGHLEMLAELFNAEAEVKDAMKDNEEADAFARKALILFEFVDNESKTYSADRFNKIQILKKRLAAQ